MISPANIICQLLIDLGHAGSVGEDWPAFVSFLPDVPHDAICVYDTAGRPDGRLMENGVRIEHYGIQIRIRSLSYLTVWQKASDIALALDTIRRTLVSVEYDEAFIVHNISRTGTILSVGIDEVEKKRRYYLTVNAVVTIPDTEDFDLFITEDGRFLVDEELGRFITTN